MGKRNCERVRYTERHDNLDQAALQILELPHLLDSKGCVSPCSTDAFTCPSPHFIADSKTEGSVLAPSSQGSHQSLKKTDTVCNSDRLPSPPICAVIPVEESVLLRSRGTTIEYKDRDPNEVKFQPLKPPLKRFIMFDRCKGRQQIFVQPAFTQQMPCATNSTVRMSHGWSPVSSMVGMAADFTGKVSQPYFCSQLDDGSMAYRETVASAFETLQYTRNSRVYDLDSVDVESQLGNPYFEMEAESSSHISCNGESEGSGVVSAECYSHENSEDIDALLSSDDELGSASHSSGEIVDGVCYSETYPRKRLKGLNREGQLSANPSDGVSDTAASPESTISVNCKDDAVPFWKQDSHFSNIDTAEMYLRTVNASSEHMCSYISGQCGSARKARKQKIKSTVKTLRKIIPVGDCTDAAVVLDEAIQYLKSLQNKVRQLEVNRHDKQSRKCSDMYP